MDLRNFTREKSERKIIEDTADYQIISEGDKRFLKAKTLQGLEKFHEKLFFAPTKAIITGDIDEAKQFFAKSMDLGVEGIMIKSLTSPYKSGLRTGAMAKLKLAKDDLDLVILAAEHGRGKRAGFYSSFIVAIRVFDEAGMEEEFLEVGKVASGIKEKEGEGPTMQRLTELLMPLKISEDQTRVYFEPKIIIQVRYQEVQKSLSYNSGYALRFPRIISIRDDKNIEEIAGLEDLKKAL